MGRGIRWRLVLRVTLAAAILAGVGYHFARLLSRPELWERPLTVRWNYVIACAGLYAAGLACWGVYFARLVRRYEPAAMLTPLVGVYLISHVAKYVPGKALVIIVRAVLGRRWRAPAAVSSVATVYEALAVMSCGAALAAVVAAVVPTGRPGLAWRAALVLTIAVTPVIPGVFNALARRLTRRFLPEGHPPLGRLPVTALAEGFAFGLAGWLPMGLSLYCLLAAVLPEPPEWSPGLVVQLAAWNAMATVVGFLAVPVPGGVGVRELVLQRLLVAMPLATPLDDGYAALAALACRLVWATTEVVLAMGLSAVLWLTQVRP